MIPRSQDSGSRTTGVTPKSWRFPTGPGSDADVGSRYQTRSASRLDKGKSRCICAPGCGPVTNYSPSCCVMAAAIRRASTRNSAIVAGSRVRHFKSMLMESSFQDYLETVWAAREKRYALIERIAVVVANWSLGPLIEALRGLRGVELVSAATFIACTGDLRRFESKRSYLT